MQASILSVECILDTEDSPWLYLSLASYEVWLTLLEIDIYL